MGIQSAYWTMGWMGYVSGRGFRSCPFFDGYAREQWMAGYSAALTSLNTPKR